MDANESQQVIEDLEPKVERLKALYQQYFMGIEKIPPSVLRKDVERTIWRLRRERLQNTRLRFKFQQIIQRYNTYSQYWARIMREIEKGTYKRDLMRAAKRVGLEEARSMGGRAAEAALHGMVAEETEQAQPRVWELGGGAQTADPWQQLTAEQQSYYAQYGYDADSYRAYYQQQGQGQQAQGHSQQAYDPQAYGQQGYDPHAYDQQAYDPQAYGQQAYDPHAYDQQGYDPHAYDQQAYDPHAYDQQAYQQQAQGQQAQGYSQQAYDPYAQPGTQADQAHDPYAQYSQPGQAPAAYPQQDAYASQPGYEQGYGQQGYPAWGSDQAAQAGGGWEAEPAAEPAPAQPPPPPRRGATGADAASGPANGTPNGVRRGGALFGTRPSGADQAAAGSSNAGQGAAPAPPPRPPRRPPPAPPRQAGDDARTKQLYDEYVRARQASGSSSGVSYDKLAKSLADQKKKLLEKHGKDRKVDFEVVTKDGKAMIRPVIK